MELEKWFALNKLITTKAKYMIFCKSTNKKNIQISIEQTD